MKTTKRSHPAHLALALGAMIGETTLFGEPESRPKQSPAERERRIAAAEAKRARRRARNVRAMASTT